MSIFVWAWTHFCNIAAAFFCFAVCWCHSVYTKHKNPSTEYLFDVMILPGEINCCLSSSAYNISFYSLLSRIPPPSFPLSLSNENYKKIFSQSRFVLFCTFILFCCALDAARKQFFTSKSTLNVLKFFSIFLYSMHFKGYWKSCIEKNFF